MKTFFFRTLQSGGVIGPSLEAYIDPCETSMMDLFLQSPSQMFVRGLNTLQLEAEILSENLGTKFTAALIELIEVEKELT